MKCAFSRLVDVQPTLCLAYSELRNGVYRPYSRYSELQSILIQALGSDVVCFVVGLEDQGYETSVKTCQFPGSGERRKPPLALALEDTESDRPMDRVLVAEHLAFISETLDQPTHPLYCPNLNIETQKTPSNRENPKRWSLTDHKISTYEQHSQNGAQQSPRLMNTAIDAAQGAKQRLFLLLLVARVAFGADEVKSPRSRSCSAGRLAGAVRVQACSDSSLPKRTIAWWSIRYVRRPNKIIARGCIHACFQKSRKEGQS
jgi:hypothetical protein